MIPRSPLVALALLWSCSKPPPQASQRAGPNPPREVLSLLPADHPCRSTVQRLAQLLDSLTVQNGEGPHGPYHRVNAAAEGEFWDRIRYLPPLPGGDDLLASALELVYTRYDDNFWNGFLYHYPYLDSRKAAEIADKLLREYPQSTLTERTLWLKAFVFRVIPPEPDARLEADYPTFAEQVRHRPDSGAAQDVLRLLVQRFPEGRHACAAGFWLAQEDIRLKLLVWPKAGDPRQP